MAYRGMGNCSLDLDGSIVCDGAEDSYAAMLANAASNAPKAGYDSTSMRAPVAPFDLSTWIKTNSTAVYLGAGVLVAMAMFGGRRR